MTGAHVPADAKDVYLRALRRSGVRKEAATVARRRYCTVWRWRQEDEGFAESERLVLDDLEREGRLVATTVPSADVILRLRAWLGCSSAKLAEVFECDVSAIKKTIERGDE